MTTAILKRNRLTDPAGTVCNTIRPAAIIAQLQKILSSSVFTRSRRLREFLAYIVQDDSSAPRARNRGRRRPRKNEQTFSGRGAAFVGSAMASRDDATRSAL